MRRANSLLGLLGVILIVFAVIAGVVTGGRSVVDVVYIVLHAGLGLLAIIAYLSSGTASLGSLLRQRSTRYGANALLYSLVFVAVLGLLNYISARHSHRWDMSEAKVYSLSPQSAKVVAGLDKPLEIFAFVDGGVNPPLEDLLRTYKDGSSQVSFHMVDPERDPVTTKEKKITQLNSVYIGYGEQSTVVTQPTEETITNALIKVTRGSKTTVCMVEGHGEPDINEQESPKGFAELKEALESQNYAVKKVLLANVEKVPEDCSVVIASAAAKPYLENEIKALGDALNAGGRVLLMLPPRLGNELLPLLTEWGVSAGNDVVVDQVMRMFQGPAIGLEPITNTYGKHEITNQIKDLTSFPMTRSISAGATMPGRQVTELVKTSPSSWAETDFGGLFERRQVSLDQGVDKQGPVSVAVAVEMTNKEGPGAKARLVVFGSNEFADNKNLAGGSNFNRELMLSSIGWLSGQSDLVSISARAIRSSRVQFTQDQGTIIFFVSVLLLPELLLILGLVVWWRRSNA